MMDMSFLNTVYTDFLAFAKENPVLSGIIGLWGAGLITFFLKDIPSKILGFIVRQLTTTLVIHNEDEIYYDFLSWVSSTNLRSFVRTLNVNNAGSAKSHVSMGFGFNVFFFNRRMFFLKRDEVEANDTFRSKERITVTLLGRRHDIFIKLFNVVIEAKEDKSKTTIMKYKHGWWGTQARQFKRDLSTVILEKHVIDEITSHIDRFISNKGWYMQNGIPYRTGILLQGPPGTGKTSLIKAICAKYDKPLYILYLSGMSDESLLEAISSVPEGSIIAIEDIDTVQPTRGSANNLVVEEKDGKVEDIVNGLTLGGLLNALDGVASNEEHIVIATTNHPYNLDPALVREGRFDVKATIRNLTDETFRSFLKRFYPQEDLTGWSVKPDIPPCKAQKVIFDNLSNLPNVLKELANRRDTQTTCIPSL